MSTDTITKSAVRLAAMNMLATREHSAHELFQKLSTRFDNKELVAEVISGLTAENLQSDQRFAEAFVVMRTRQGKGPVRISLELRERGIASDLINFSVDAADVSWSELAIAERIKKFGVEVPRDMKERSRQMKFLQYRGFNQFQINAAFK